MARKDRERARKRRAIERSRRESGYEPEPKEDEQLERRRSSNGKRPPGRPSGGRRPPQGPLRKLKPGDVDRRGREFKRAMVLHPRTAMFISIGVIAAAVLGLVRPHTFQWVSYLAFTVGFLVFADSRPTWLQASLWIAVAMVCAAAGVVLLVAQISA